MDKDGTLSDPDIELISLASRNLDFPLVALGCISSLVDMRSAVKAGANAVSAGPNFIFHERKSAILIMMNWKNYSIEVFDLFHLWGCLNIVRS